MVAMRAQGSSIDTGVMRSATLNATKSDNYDELDSFVNLGKIDAGLKKPERSLYENIDLFKTFINHGEMKKIEEALLQEDFKAGDVIFNFGKYDEIADFYSV